MPWPHPDPGNDGAGPDRHPGTGHHHSGDAISEQNLPTGRVTVAGDSDYLSVPVSWSSSEEGRRERLLALGCPPLLLNEAADLLAVYVEPRTYHGRTVVAARLSDDLCRQVIALARRGRPGGAA